MTVAYPNLCYNKVCYEGTALYDHAHMARTVKTCVKQPLSKRPKIGFQDQLLLNAGQKYCRMLQESILQYFQPSLSYHLSLRSLFCLFLSGHFTQVLLYHYHGLCQSIVKPIHAKWAFSLSIG